MKIQADIEFTITDRSPQHVRAEMPVRSGILNPYGVVNAGAMLWFADVCATVLAYGKDEFVPGAPGFPLGISLNAAFVGNQKDGVFKATSSFVKRGRQLSIVRTIITGAEDRLIADVTTSHLVAK
jgi:1,4-dihydroxy-2-naphthoyl-CoA hydrolase